MGALEALIVPVIVVIVVALIIIWATERFSPDPLITKIVHVIVFAFVLIFLVTKLLPLLMGGAHAEEFPRPIPIHSGGHWGGGGGHWGGHGGWHGGGGHWHGGRWIPWAVGGGALLGGAAYCWRWNPYTGEREWVCD